MARPKKTNKKTSTRGRKATAKTAAPKSQDAIIKLLKGTATRRPPNNPDVPQDIINSLNTDLNSIKELLDSFSQHLRALDRCRKAKGFSARSLRYAQTPHINSWSFAKHNTSQKSIDFFKNKKNCNFLFGKTPSYTA